MPKLFHWESDTSHQTQASGSTTPSNPTPPAAKRVSKIGDITSGQVNFGCDATLPVETPVVSFRKNPKDIDARPTWVNTDYVKTQNQSVVNVEDPANHHITGVKAVGSISGRDSQTIAFESKTVPAAVMAS